MKEKSVFASLEIIERNILEKLTVENLARDIHFSKFHYQRLFREIVGENVMAYVARRRLDLAARALLESDAAILDIALAHGYESHEGFSRAFKARMGVTPSEYRKYRLYAPLQNFLKERENMAYSKSTDEIIRELNAVIVAAKETADFARKHGAAEISSSGSYAQFWEFMADKADEMANGIQNTLNGITAIGQRPDEISARFAIMKILDNVSFMSNLSAFHGGLMAARGGDEAQSAFEPIVTRFYNLAKSSNIGNRRVAELFAELTSLIFDNMRKVAEAQLQKVAKTGQTLAASLRRGLPYGYIADEIVKITDELTNISIENIQIRQLEYLSTRLESIIFAADTDAFRAPEHKDLLGGINDFAAQIVDLLDNLQNLPSDPPPAFSTREINFQNITLQSQLLYFHIRGEIEKMGKFGDCAKSILDAICGKMESVINMAISQSPPGEIADMVSDTYNLMIQAADELSEHGGAIRFIAAEINYLAKRVAQC